MADNKLKHLEFIQNVITRMNSNSFLIKGWAITLVSALFALAASGANSRYVMISYIVLPVFWMLDGFYISQERKYRKLYSRVIEVKEENIDFKMDTQPYSTDDTRWINAIFSKTLLPFYGVSLVVTLGVMFLMDI